MSSSKRKKMINVLKVLLTLEDIDVIKCTIESLIEELEDSSNNKERS